MKLSIQQIQSYKYFAVANHPYFPCPYYTYEQVPKYQSELPGNDKTSVYFSSSFEKGAEITVVEDEEKFFFAWTPEVPKSENFLIQQMYSSFLPSFLSRKGISNWFFTTQFDEASCFRLSSENEKGNICLFTIEEGRKEYYSLFN